MTELQRIANVLKIKNIGDERLCLIIQDKIKEKDEEIKKLRFTNKILHSKTETSKIQVNNLKNEYAENIGIGEYMRIKNSYENLKSNYKKTLEDNHNLRSSIEQYRESELKDRLKKIINV